MSTKPYLNGYICPIRANVAYLRVYVNEVLLERLYTLIRAVVLMYVCVEYFVIHNVCCTYVFCSLSACS